MTKKTKKPFYGLVALASSILIAATFTIVGVLVFFFYSNLLGIIIFCIGLYSLSSYLVSIYLINPFKSLDLSNILELKGDEILLDVGCGLGRATIGATKLLKTGKVIGVDIWDRLEIPGNSQEKAYENADIEGVKDKVEFRYGDTFDLPFDDYYFDVVICSGLITSFHSDEQKLKAMKEIRRVLKTNGTFLMREPVKKLKSLIILTPQVLLIKLPSKNHWIELLEKSGFKKIDYYPHRISGSFKMIKP
ncbi:MAG: class I SAM-dependent methyltransferase [Euryarchaeota archaeon]|nr:class I SAM-dependent methyltransferase [Euryarchaeota archaeon]